MFDIIQFRNDIVRPALRLIQLDSCSLEELLVFTCAVESAGGTYVRQKENGPALGIYQIEPATYTDLWVNYIIRKPDLVNLLSINLGIHRMPDIHEVIFNLYLATACCALLYKYRKVLAVEAITEDWLWDNYKEHYNTEKGAATKDNSIRAYRKFIKV